MQILITAGIWMTDSLFHMCFIHFCFVLQFFFVKVMLIRIQSFTHFFVQVFPQEGNIFTQTRCT